MQNTVNYGLNKPNYSDQYDLRHWNDNMDMIDSQMKSEETSRINADALKENLANKKTSWSTTPNDNNYPSEKLVKDSLDTKENSSNKVSSFGTTPNDTNYPTEKLVKDNLDLKENLANKVTSFQSTPDNTHYPSEKLVKDNLDIKENSFNKVTSFQTTPDDTHYPSEKLVKDSLDAKANVTDINSCIFYEETITANGTASNPATSTLQSMSVNQIQCAVITVNSPGSGSNWYSIKLPSNGRYFIIWNDNTTNTDSYATSIKVLNNDTEIIKKTTTSKIVYKILVIRLS